MMKPEFIGSKDRVIKITYYIEELQQKILIHSSGYFTRIVQ